MISLMGCRPWVLFQAFSYSICDFFPLFSCKQVVILTHFHCFLIWRWSFCLVLNQLFLFCSSPYPSTPCFPCKIFFGSQYQKIFSANLIPSTYCVYRSCNLVVFSGISWGYICNIFPWRCWWWGETSSSGNYLWLQSRESSLRSM